MENCFFATIGCQKMLREIRWVGISKLTFDLKFRGFFDRFNAFCDVVQHLDYLDLEIDKEFSRLVSCYSEYGRQKGFGRLLQYYTANKLSEKLPDSLCMAFDSFAHAITKELDAAPGVCLKSMESVVAYLHLTAEFIKYIEEERRKR